MKKLPLAGWLAKTTFLALLLAGTFSARATESGDDPFTGYKKTTSYFLPYAAKTSFAPGITSDVQVAVTIDGKEHIFNIDTGSRGLYASSSILGPDFKIAPNAFRGEIDLSSSGRVSSGWWTPTTLTFKVKDNNGNDQTITSTAYILDVTTLGAQSGRTAFFGINTKVPGYDGKVKLIDGTKVDVTTAPNGHPAVYLSHENGLNQRARYSDNIPGLIGDVSNFGIGFDLGGAPTGTGPVTDNKNQIYNVLINFDKMKDGTLVGGYIITPTGIQLGLTSKDTGYAYTTLTPTDLTSAYTAPDWQTPMGQTVANKVTNPAGMIVMDSGIPNSFISAPGLPLKSTITTPMDVFLMNSGGAVGYHIDLSDATNKLNPTSVLVVPAGTKGTYSQALPPYQGQFFNTGRNVFIGFNTLYDAENGYMGVLPTTFGATDKHIFFKAQAGGYPNPLTQP